MALNLDIDLSNFYLGIIPGTDLNIYDLSSHLKENNFSLAGQTSGHKNKNDNGQPEIESLEQIDLNKEATIAHDQTNQILRDLRSKLENFATGDVQESRFIRGLPQ